MLNVPCLSGIYKLTNKINGKIYIGKAKNLYKRLSQHRRAYDKNLICIAIRKYGWENFNIEILAEFTYIDNVELLGLETAFIVSEKSLTPNGYNVCLFASDKTGTKSSIKTKQKISKNHKRPMLGKKHSQETKERMSRNHANFSGKNHPRYGKHHTIKSIKKIRKSNLGQKRSIITKLKNSISHLKPIKQINPFTNEVIKIWDGAIIAKRELNVNHSNIIQVCLGRRKTANGFKWEYV